MGKKKEDKKRKKNESALESLISEKDLNNSEILADIIAVLKKFCDDNILALRPLLEEVEDNDAIKERIIHFITLSDILDSVEQLAYGGDILDTIGLLPHSDETEKTVNKKKPAKKKK